MLWLSALIIMLTAILNVPVVVRCAAIHTQAAHITVVCVMAVAAVRVSPLGVDLGGSLLANKSQVNNTLPRPNVPHNELLANHLQMFVNLQS